ncbi:MAG: Ig-like domain-containing protein, partial [Candidatus Latescibacterota bacterium]|nr:Ig-like domain-containing protein [Candidatus Latescibacterota bacterium]
MSHTVLVKPAPGRIERSMRLAKTVGMRLTGFLCFAGQGRRALSSRFGLSLPQAVLVSALLHLMLPASVSAAEYLVYADIFNDRIMRAGLDGSNPTVLASNLKDPLSLAVDEQNGKIYYSTYQGGHQAIRRVNLDGSGGDVLVGNLTGFSGLVHMNLNPGTGRIYYYHSGMNPRTIKYFDIANGSSGTTFDGSGVSTNLRDIAIDRANNAVYSIDQAGKIRRVNANGSVDVVYTPSGSGGGTSWWGIAYNPSDQKIYFGSNKYMHRVNANGSGYQQLSGVSYSYSYAVAVDSKNSKLYWGEYGTMFRSNLDGSNKQTVITGSVVSANTSYITAISIAGQGSSASNQSPVATAQSVSVNEDTQLSITLAGTDPEGASLSYALASNPSHGNASLSGNTVTFTPTANYAGSDSFTFTVSDGSITSSAATVSITVNAVNDTPVATAQSVSTNEDTQLSITLAGTDPEGASLSYALASNPSHGNASLSGNTVTYAPTTNYSGSDSFTFTVSDGSITSSAATVSITVNAVNDVPVATAQSVIVNENTQLSITLAGTDTEGASLSYALVSNPSHGNASLSGNTVTFTPTTNYSGSDSFTFRVSDGSATSSAATVSLAINGAPTATAQSVSTNEDTQLAITLAGTDPEGSNLTYALASNPSHGNASLSGNTVTYTPAANYFGSDSFKFTVSDGRITSPQATVSLSVSAVNDAPTVSSVSVAAGEDTQQSIVLSSGSDVDGDDLTYALASNPSKGTATLSGNTVTYTPNSNYSGSDSFTFKASDGSLTSSAGTVFVTMNAVNDAPVATAQSVSTNEDTQLSITLAGTDPEGSNLTYALASNPSKGTASLSGNTVTFTPTTNYSGSDSFTFKVSDGSLTSSAATVSITVNAVNDAPVATAQSVSVNEDTQLSITLAGTDIEGSNLTYALASNPSKGTASLSGNTVTFTPTTNYSGSDSFTFKVSDGS